MKRNPLLTILGFPLIAALLVACAGQPARVSEATRTVAPAITVASTQAVPPAAVEPTAAGTAISSHGGLAGDYASLIDTLRAGGATVNPAGQITQPFFSPAGQAIKVNGADVQVFEYPDQATANAEAAKVAADGGSIGTSMVSWVAAPHFYEAGKIIVLYVGSDASVMGALNKALGAQFAGR